MLLVVNVLSISLFLFMAVAQLAIGVSMVLCKSQRVKVSDLCHAVLLYFAVLWSDVLFCAVCAAEICCDCGGVVMLTVAAVGLMVRTSIHALGCVASRPRC